MKRRRLLQAAAVSLLPVSCEKMPETTQSATLATPPAAGAAPPPFSTLADLTTMLREKKTNPATLVAYYQKRIAELNKAGPKINAVLELNPDAATQAGAAKTGLLQGLPVLIKDNIETADTMHTTAGSLALMGSKPREDAALVTRLREAGAVILGKTNLSEWANLRSPNSTSGWSARGGLTLNPHDGTRTASGSSSGSAAAVAAGLAPAAIGTETNGSIVSPASACGIVGFKPTVGLISGQGIIPITHWQDTAGPMTLTVQDAALLMRVLAEGFSVELPANSLKGARLGVLRQQSGTNPQVQGLLDATLRKLHDAGVVIVDNVGLPAASKASSLAWKAMLIEFRQDLNAYLAKRGGDVKSLAELIAFNDDHADAEMPHFGQEFFLQAESLGAPESVEAGRVFREEARKLAGPEGIDVALKAHQLDALICPTNDPAGLVDLAKGDAHHRVASAPAAIAGYPHLTVPMGFVDGLPIGCSFIGTAKADARILALGHGFEKLIQGWKAPALKEL